MPATRKKRIPQLKHTDVRNIGWHVSYRDPNTGTPRKYIIGNVPRSTANEAYQKWLAAHLAGETPKGRANVLPTPAPSKAAVPAAVDAKVVPGSLLEVASGYLAHEESRVRADDGPRVKNTIKRKQFEHSKRVAHEFLDYLNRRYGKGAVGRMTLADLQMGDVERYNKQLVENGLSDSQVKKRMQIVEGIILRAGRPEHGQQQLPWNWRALDKVHGTPDTPITLPTLKQLKLVLEKCDVARTCQVWMAIGLGFGQRDLAAARVGQFDAQSYDCRRGKTGMQRYGDMPKMVWTAIQAYLTEVPRPAGELLFLTDQGRPLVHGKTDSVGLWWADLRASLGADGDGLNGFYSLRHLGATEFGSRPGCSIGDMRRWLGHSVSSSVADRYMKPVSPENRDVIEWVRKALATGRADLQIEKPRRKPK